MTDTVIPTADPTGQAAAATAAADAARSAASTAADTARRLPSADEVKRMQADFDKFAASQGKPHGAQAEPAQPAGDKAPNGAEQPVSTDGAPAITFEFANRDLDSKQLVALNRDTNEAVTALALDPDFARGAVASLDRAIHARNGRAMDQGELAAFDAKLQNLWGDQHAANSELVKAAFAKAGKHGEWLARSIMSAGPVVAAQAFASLANSRRSRA